jgi:hypothetical protein
LIKAIHHGKHDLIDALEASGVQLYSTPQLPAAIAAAVHREDIRVLRLLLGDNSRYRTRVVESLPSSLCAAIAKGRNDITEKLLAAGAEVTGEGHLREEDPLLGAIRRKDAHLVRRLLAAGAAVNEKGLFSSSDWLECTTVVLPAVVASGNYPLIGDIASAGVEVKGPECEGGKTALTVAVEIQQPLSF